MRKQLVFNVCEQEVTLDVTFDAIERLERVFNANADMIGSVILPNSVNLRYTTLANAVADLLVGHLPKDVTRAMVKEYVLGCTPEEMGRFAILLSTMCLYLRKHLTPEAFDAVVESQKGDKAKKPITDALSSRNRRSRSSTK